MAEDRYRRVIASTPINATAGRVVARGEHWEPDQPIPADRAHWTAPPNDCQPKPDGEPDLAGARFGRFTAVKYRRVLPHLGRRLWLVRCSCGDYEERTTYGILAAQQDPEAYSGQMCWNCERLAVLQKRSEGVGEWPEERLKRVLAPSDGVAAMEPAEFHEIRAHLGWSVSDIAVKAKRDRSRIKKMASGKEPIDQQLADWLRQQRYRKNAGLTD